MKCYNDEFKTKDTLAALKNEQTISELALRFSIDNVRQVGYPY